MITFKLNGQERTFDGDPETPLLWVIRDFEKLTGTKYGCGIAQCGACTVHLDGTHAPLLRHADLDGRRLRHHHDRGHRRHGSRRGQGSLGRDRRAAMRLLSVRTDHVGGQRCCRSTPKPTDADIDGAMAGNICRCATYHRIRQAIHDAADTMEG